MHEVFEQNRAVQGERAKQVHRGRRAQAPCEVGPVPRDVGQLTVEPGDLGFEVAGRRERDVAGRKLGQALRAGLVPMHDHCGVELSPLVEARRYRPDHSLDGQCDGPTNLADEKRRLQHTVAERDDQPRIHARGAGGHRQCKAARAARAAIEEV